MQTSLPRSRRMGVTSSMARRVEKMDTDTIDNVLMGETAENRLSPRYEEYCRQSKQFYRDLHDACERFKLNTVGLHQSILGAWDFTFQSGGYRYRVWEFPTWRIFVANGYGVGFEVLQGIAPEDAMTAWKEYIKKMDLEHRASISLQ